MITLTEHLIKIANLPSLKRTEARRANMIALNAARPWMTNRLCSECGTNRLRNSNKSGVCRDCNRNPSRINKLKI